MRGWKSLGIATVLAFGAATSVQAQYVDIYANDTHYGAIVLSGGESGLIYGVGTNYTSSGQAVSAARRDCKKKGAQNCVAAVTFVDSCGALASAMGGKWVAIKTKYREDAKATALAKCQDSGFSECRVEIVACAEDV